MNIKEFREFGYLQELNRKYLHPLGLALEVTIDEKGHEIGTRCSTGKLAKKQCI
jgi:hypothetical protein